MSSINWGQLAGSDRSLKGDRLDISQQWGTAVLGITGSSGVSFFLFLLLLLLPLLVVVYFILFQLLTCS